MISDTSFIVNTVRQLFKLIPAKTTTNDVGQYAWYFHKSAKGSVSRLSDGGARADDR